MKPLLLVVCLLAAPWASARLLPPSHGHAVSTGRSGAVPDPAMVRTLPASAMPRDAIVPVQSVQSVARITLESSVARPAPAAVRREEGLQWGPLTSEQRWQQYTYP